MKKKIIPEDLQNEENFELLVEVSHENIREFVLDQISKEKQIVRIYSGYQAIMLLILAFFFTRSIIYSIKDIHLPLAGFGLAVLLSFSALIVLHELIHALAYWLSGAKKISFGFILKKFVFYAQADQQVIASGPFHFVALLPFIVVKLLCLAGIILIRGDFSFYFFITVMCLHSLFCAGDMAMLAFYNLNKEKEIYNYDNRLEGKTYFYARKSPK